IVRRSERRALHPRRGTRDNERLRRASRIPSASRSRAMSQSTPTPPAGGARITIANGVLAVPDQPIIPFIEGDGTGPDIWRASVRVLDAAVAKAYGGKRKIHWMEILAGEKAFNQPGNWLPDASVDACRDYL